MAHAPSAVAVRPEPELEEADPASDPVLRSVLSAPVRPGRAPAWEAEVLRDAAAGRWFEGATVTAEIAARALDER